MMKKINLILNLILTFVIIGLLVDKYDLKIFTVNEAIAQTEKTQWFIKLTPVRQTFSIDATPAENLIINQHFERLKKLSAQDKIILGGPILAEYNPFGIIIAETNSRKEALEIIQNDPAVLNNIFTAELYPMRVLLLKSKK